MERYEAPYLTQKTTEQLLALFIYKMQTVTIHGHSFTQIEFFDRKNFSVKVIPTERTWGNEDKLANDYVFRFLGFHEQTWDSNIAGNWDPDFEKRMNVVVEKMLSRIIRTGMKASTGQSKKKRAEADKLLKLRAKKDKASESGD